MTKRLFFSILTIITMIFSSLSPASAGDSCSFSPPSVTSTAPKNGAVPVGTIIIWPASSNPEGWSEGKWLACNGQSVSSASYPELASLGFSSVPNLNERVPWGVNSSPGAYRNAGLPNITGEFVSTDHVLYPSLARGAFRGATATDQGTRDHQLHGGNPIRFTFNAANSNAIYGRSSTVQPAAYTVRYLIRAKP